MSPDPIDSKSRLSLELLSLLLTVVNEGTISAAARRWNIAPSLANRKIAALERELQTRLFDRTTRRIHLTDAGESVVDWARQVLQGHARLTEDLSLRREALSGTIRLVTNEYVCTIMLPPFFAAFSRRYPSIRYDVRMTDALVGADDRDYDVAVHSGKVPDSALKGIRVRDVQRVLCASPAYLKRAGIPRDLRDLEHHDCLGHQQTANGIWTFERRGKIFRQAVTQIFLVNSYLPLVELARSGMGIIRTSRGSVQSDLESGALVEILSEFRCVHPDGSVPGTWILYPDGRMVQRTKTFIAELSEYLKGLPY